MVNPFEQTAQAARDWNPREQYISSFNEDRTRNAPIEFLLNEERNKQQRWEDVGGENAYPTINTNRSPANPNPYNPGWIEAGITNPNLGGAKVWQAGGVGDWFQNLNPFNWRNKNEQLQKKLDEIRRQTDEIRMHPLFPKPGPWNEFDPSTFFDEGDEGGVDWTPSEEFLEGTSEVAQSQWKRPENMEKTIQALKLRPEFEGWTDGAIENWIRLQAKQEVNRGGIIGLL